MKEIVSFRHSQKSSLDPTELGAGSPAPGVVKLTLAMISTRSFCQTPTQEYVVPRSILYVTVITSGSSSATCEGQRRASDSRHSPDSLRHVCSSGRCVVWCRWKRGYKSSGLGTNSRMGGRERRVEVGAGLSSWAPLAVVPPASTALREGARMLPGSVWSILARAGDTLHKPEKCYRISRKLHDGSASCLATDCRFGERAARVDEQGCFSCLLMITTRYCYKISLHSDDIQHRLARQRSPQSLVSYAARITAANLVSKVSLLIGISIV